MRDDDTFDVAETDLGLDGAQPDVSYTLRLLPIEQMKALHRKNTQKVRSPRSGVLVSGETDSIGFGFDAFDYCVVDWSGITLNGQPAPCSRDNKLLLAKNAALVTAIARRCGFGGDTVGTQEDSEESFRATP
jgi:hypothetical protein